MHTIYLTDNGLQIKKKSNRIVVKKEGNVQEEIPILNLKRVLIFGNNQLSTELMRYLSSKGIEVAFLSSHGKFKFRLVPETSKNIYIRMAQHDCYHDQDFRINWSRSIIKGKLKNQKALLIRYRRNQPKVDLDGSIKMLKDCIQNVKGKDTIEGIMGLEGIGSRAYFQAYGKLLIGDFKFLKREYYPAPDPVNALLSFGYMLVFNELNSLLEACGFDVFIGFLHSIRYGRASLAADMIEELRSPVIDRLVIYLINKGVVKPTQFILKEKKGARMTDEARKTFLTNYEKFMTTYFMDVKTKKRTNFRQIIQEKIMELDRAILNKIVYEPYVFYS